MSQYSYTQEEKALIESFSNQEFERQVKWIREEWDISEEEFNPILLFNHRTNAGPSWAAAGFKGELWVSLSTYAVVEDIRGYNKLHYGEYSYISKKRGIGDLKNVSWRVYLRCLISHELAHLLMEDIRTIDALRPDFPCHVVKDRRDHGLFWQAIYKRVRRFAVRGKKPLTSA